MFIQKIKNAHKRVLHNKRGVTLVELIAVVAIMGVLAVTIGSLLTSATSAYMRQKEIANAKELSQIVAKEIARQIERSQLVFLQGDYDLIGQEGYDGNLPGDGYDDEGEVITSYKMGNKPFVGYDFVNCLYSDTKTEGKKGGKLMYNNGELETNESYFTKTADEERAFYGNYSVQVYYMAIKNQLDNFVGVRIFADVYKDGKLKYESKEGRVVKFLKVTEPSFTGSILFNYQKGFLRDDADTVLYKDSLITADKVEITEKDGRKFVSARYKNVINDTTKYTHLYFA